MQLIWTISDSDVRSVLQRHYGEAVDGDYVEKVTDEHFDSEEAAIRVDQAARLYNNEFAQAASAFSEMEDILIEVGVLRGHEKLFKAPTKE